MLYILCVRQQHLRVSIGTERSNGLNLEKETALLHHSREVATPFHNILTSSPKDVPIVKLPRFFVRSY